MVAIKFSSIFGLAGLFCHFLSYQAGFFLIVRLHRPTLLGKTRDFAIVFVGKSRHRDAVDNFSTTRFLSHRNWALSHLTRILSHLSRFSPHPKVRKLLILFSNFERKVLNFLNPFLKKKAAVCAYLWILRNDDRDFSAKTHECTKMVVRNKRVVRSNLCARKALVGQISRIGNV